MLTSESGSGKSYLMSFLYREAKRIGLKVFRTNYDAANFVDSLVNSISGYDFALLDNADLYMSYPLCKQLNSLGIPIVVSLHNIEKVDTSKCPIYRVYYDSNDMHLIPMYNVKK